MGQLMDRMGRSKVILACVLFLAYVGVTFGTNYKIEHERAQHRADLCEAITAVKTAVTKTQVYNGKHPLPVPEGSPAFVQQILDQVNSNSKHNTKIALRELDKSEACS